MAPAVIFSERTWTESDYVQERETAAKKIAKAIGVSEKKAKILYVVSAFIGKSGYKKEAQQLINANGPDATAKTGSAETSNCSIRNHDSVVNKEFSDRDPTAEATRADLEKENVKLREDVSRLRELLSLQGKVTGGTVIKKSLDTIFDYICGYIKNNEGQNEYAKAPWLFPKVLCQ